MAPALERAFDLVRLQANAPDVRVQMYMAWHDRTDQDPAMQFFRSLIEEIWSRSRARRR